MVMQPLRDGDRVLVRSDLIVNEFYNGIDPRGEPQTMDVVEDMMDYIGKICTIRVVGYTYRISGDLFEFFWTTGMFECIISSRKEKRI